jgi:membrane protease YdiL (CAAX protease family)
VRFEPKLPGITLAWSLHNLFFVCVLEELVFRNYLFEGLRRRLGQRKHAIFHAAAISSLVFGLTHFRGGPALILLATLAGGAYTFAYVRSGLAAAVLSHFGVNAIHFLLFSYPALQKGLQ